MEYVVKHRNATERGYYCLESALYRAQHLEQYGATNLTIWSLDSDGVWEQVA